MKYSWLKTIEILLWTALATILSLLLTPFMTNREQITTPTQTVFLIFGSIILGAVVALLFVRKWSVLPNWMKATLKVVGFLFLVSVMGTMVSGVITILTNFRISDATSFGIAIASMALFAITMRELNARKNLEVWSRVHNFFMIFLFAYAGASFASRLNILTFFLLLTLVAVYDAIAVWKLGTMQEMAKGLVKSGFIPGLIIPKQNDGTGFGEFGLLGGGDVLFIALGSCVMFLNATTTLWIASTAGMFVGLAFLFIGARKEKMYPAIPFIWAGFILGALLGFIL